MTTRGDSLGYSRNPGSNYYAGLTHQSTIDLNADDAAKVSAFHSLWVGKAGGKLLWRGPTSRVRASSASVPHLPDADHPAHATSDGQTRDLPGSDAILSHVMCS